MCCLVTLLVCKSVGWLVDLLFGLLTGWLFVGWFIGWLVSWLVGCLLGLLFVCADESLIEWVCLDSLFVD